MGLSHSNENNRVNESDTNHAAYTPENISDILYISIVKIITENGHKEPAF